MFTGFRFGNFPGAPRGSRKKTHPQRLGRRRLYCEQLESREVLSTTIPSFINGTAFVDTTINGTFDAGEQLDGALIQLFNDSNGNNAFNPGIDTQAAPATTTTANGAYSFTNLAAGSYFVVQPAQTASNPTLGNISLQQRISGVITLATGADGTSIDASTTASGRTTDGTTIGATTEVFPTSPATFADVLGGQRDFTAQILTFSSTFENVSMFNDGGFLFVNPDFNSTGRYTVTWDGLDAPGDGLNHTGLRNAGVGVDLTAVGGVTGIGTGICIHDAQFDEPNAIIRVRVYTDANNFSEAIITNVPQDISQDIFIPFTGSNNGVQFTTQAGSGANFSNVGAIELEVEATEGAMDGMIGLLNIIGPDSAVVNISNPAPIPAVDIEKLTNGNQADLATDADVPDLVPNQQVTWTYVVTNAGGLPLTNVIVTDDVEGPVSNIISRSINGDNILDINEVWTYTLTGTVVAGTYENKGTVTGLGGTTQVMDMDFSHYTAGSPQIDVEKATNGQDADQPGTGPQVFVGSEVRFTFIVTNPGDVVLSNIQLTDDNGTPNLTTDDFSPTFSGGDTNGNAQLELTETWTYIATRSATLGPYNNTASVAGQSPTGQQVTDSDPSNHTALALPAVISKRRFLASQL